MIINKTLNNICAVFVVMGNTWTEGLVMSVALDPE
jgi:hypothetical protein